MKRTTISLPDELAAAVDRAARRRRVPVSALARDALAAYLGFDQDGEKRELPFASVGASGERDTARRLEDLLAQEWGEDARGR
jgi:predicted transcriptional regulator